MEQEGKLKNEDEEREFSSSDSDSATFVYISSLSEAIEYYPPILQDSTDYRELEERYEVEPWQVRIETQLGKGFFSYVHKGELSLMNETITVAIKMPKKDSTDEHLQRSALRGELLTMAYLQLNESGGHENILKLVGAITTSRINFCILTEFCDLGSLDKFLCKKYDNDQYHNELIILNYEENQLPSKNEDIWMIQQDPNWNDLFEERRNAGIITTSDLLWFALQIARAMQYLTEMKVVHRDMALRNVLLMSDFTLRVADFGLSRRLFYGDDSYKVLQHNVALPIRHTAPESLRTGRFSIHSECWSFAVVVWELFTFAKQQPYSAEYELYGNRQPFFNFLVGELSAGLRLTIPPTVPKALKNLMTELWNGDPESRPSFQTCRKTIRKILVKSCPQIIERSSHSDNLNACEISSLKIEEQSIECSTDKKKWKSSWLLKLIILSVALIAIFAIAIVALVVLLKSQPSDPMSPANGTVRWIPGVNVSEAILLHPMPKLNGIIMVLNPSDVIFVDFISEKNNILILGNLYSERYRSESLLLSVVVVERSNKIHYICLYEDVDTHSDPYRIKSYVQGEIDGKPVQRIDFKHERSFSIDHWNVTTFIKKLYIAENDEIFCVCSGWQTLESGEKETIFFVYKIFVDRDGGIYLNLLDLNPSDLNPSDGIQPRKINGAYFAPFFFLNSIHWPLQQVTMNNSITVTQSPKIIVIDLFDGQLHSYKLSNFHNDPVPYPNFFLPSPILIKDYICYFATFESSKRNALFCIKAHTTRIILYLNDQHLLINNVVISSTSDTNRNIVYLHGYTESREPYFEIIDFEYLLRVHNPLIVPLDSKVSDIWINEANIGGRNITSICLLPDGTRAFFSVTNSGTIFSITLNSDTHSHAVSNLTSVSDEEEIEQMYTLRSNSSTYIVCVVRNLTKKLLLKAFKITGDSIKFVTETHLNITDENSSIQKYLATDDKGALYFVAYAKPVSDGYSYLAYIYVHLIDVTEDGIIFSSTLFPNYTIKSPRNDTLQRKRPFVFKNDLFLVDYDTPVFALQISLDTQEETRGYFSNTLYYLTSAISNKGEDKIAWSSAPIIIEDLVFTYVLRNISRDGIDYLGQLIYLDMSRKSWFAIEHTVNIIMKPPVTLMRSNDYKLAIYGLAEDKSGSLKPSIRIIDVKEVVQLQKNRSFPLDGVESKWSY